MKVIWGACVALTVFAGSSANAQDQSVRNLSDEQNTTSPNPKNDSSSAKFLELKGKVLRAAKAGDKTEFNKWMKEMVHEHRSATIALLNSYIERVGSGKAKEGEIVILVVYAGGSRSYANGRLSDFVYTNLNLLEDGREQLFFFPDVNASYSNCYIRSSTMAKLKGREMHMIAGPFNARVTNPADKNPASDFRNVVTAKILI